MKTWLRSNRGFLLFLLGFVFVRTAIADWNPIPSGSMRPTLLEGDVVLVNRVAYDFKLPLTDRSLARLGEPRRGDIVTFTSPADGMRLIKRIVALPGDVVEMRAGRLFVNGEAAVYADALPVAEPVASGFTVDAVRAREQLLGTQHAVQFLPGAVARRDFAAAVVPADHLFMLGDNRDASADSRYFGMVPRHLLIGRAHRIVVSADITGAWWPRWERFAQPLR